MAYKYPWIPRKYYAAVMFACKMIRENNQFNRACRVASEYYDVDEYELRKHVSARAGAGKKGKKVGTMKWFIVKIEHGTDALGPSDECEYEIVRGKNLGTVERRWMAKCMRWNADQNPTGSAYAPYIYPYVHGPYEHKKDAEDALSRAMTDKSCPRNLAGVSN
jgi:hypothetical protein